MEGQVQTPSLPLDRDSLVAWLVIYRADIMNRVY